MHEPVRHIASSTRSWIAVAAFTELVEVWDVVAARRISAFRTSLDFGGRRLCLAPDGSRCFAGAYHRFGVAAYRSADGTRQWSRPDVKRVQYVSTSSDGRRVYVGVASGPLVILDATDGSTVERMRGVRRVFESSSTVARLLDRSTPVVEGASLKTFSVPRTTFAILDVAFGPSSVCISEAGGPTRCVELTNGREIWRHDPPPGEHLLSVAYAASAGAFVGVCCEYEKTATTFLVRFGPRGQVDRLAALGRTPEAEFCLSGEALALSDGRLFESSSGELLRIIPFEKSAG